MGLTDKEWRNIEIIVVGGIFAICVLGFQICQGGIRDNRVEASNNLKAAVDERNGLIKGIVSDIKDYETENIRAHKKLLYSQYLIAAKLGVSLPEPE